MIAGSALIGSGYALVFPALAVEAVTRTALGLALTALRRRATPDPG